MVSHVYPLIWPTIFSLITVTPTFGLLTNSLYDHEPLSFTDFQSFPSFNHFTSIDQDEMMPMDSIWSPGHQSVDFQSPFSSSLQNHHLNPFMMTPNSFGPMHHPSLLDGEPSMSTESYSRSNRIGFGYSAKGKSRSEIPEDVIDGIVAKVLVDEKLNPIFNPRRSKPFRQGSQSGYKKMNANGYKTANVNNQRNGKLYMSDSSKKGRPLDSGLQDLSRYVKSLRTVAWDDERLEKDDGSPSSPSSSYGEGEPNGSLTNYGPVFKTKYAKSDGSYNVYGFLVPMGSKLNNKNNGNSNGQPDKVQYNVTPSAYGRKIGHHKPCDSPGS